MQSPIATQARGELKKDCYMNVRVGREYYIDMEDRY